MKLKNSHHTSRPILFTPVVIFLVMVCYYFWQFSFKIINKPIILKIIDYTLMFWLILLLAQIKKLEYLQFH